MRKLFFFAALLAVAASCTKNEVIPQNDGNKEITYLTAPLTKASPFSKSNKFYSYAYLLRGGNQWATASGNSVTFFSDAEISYHTSVWKADQSYYWPKDEGSSLTFFAWTNGTGSLDPDIAACSNDAGVQFPDYNITSTGNKNKDMMVAKIAADQKANTDPGIYDTSLEGVPTLFYHVLSSLDIRAQRAENYANTTFNIVSIKFNDVSVEGSYEQGIDAAKLPTAGSWSEADPAVTADLDVYTPAAATQVDGLATATPEATFTSLTPDGYSVFLPHTLTDSETVTIVYEINNGLSTETVTVTKSLKEIFGSWDAGKKYTLTITLSLNEILWDPAVADWAAGTGSWSL